MMETMKTYPKTCQLCGKDFLSKAPRTVYCSEECRITSRRAQQRELERLHYKPVEFWDFTCQLCGRNIRVYGRTCHRKACTACLEKTAYGRKLISNRADLREEIIEEG